MGTVAAAVACATAAPAYAQGVTIDSDTFGGLAARAIGPAAMSGRISALDAVAGDRLTIYRRVGRRRPLAVGRRRASSSSRSSTSTPRRSAPSRSTRRTEDRLGRHRRVLGAQQRVAWRRRVPERRRRRLVDPARPRTDGAHRPDSRAPEGQQHGVRVRDGPPVRRPSGPRGVPDEGCAASRGRRCCMWRRTSGAAISRWIRRTPRCCTPGCGSSGGRRGSSRLAGRAAGSIARGTAAPRGSGSARDLPAGDLGRIALAVSPVKAERGLRDGRIEEDDALPVRRSRRDVDRR